jgi:hypothetical protein
VFGRGITFFVGLVALLGTALAFAIVGLMVEDSALLLGACAGLLTEYGPAVAGLWISGRGRNLVGRIGATESPPCDTDVGGSGRVLITVVSDAIDVIDDVELPETVRMGEKVYMADPGRASIFLAAATAFF